MIDLNLKPSEPIPDRVARAGNDYYPTPAWCVERILPHLPHARTVLDPACGAGELLAHFPDSEQHGIELDPTRATLARNSRVGITCADALATDTEWPRCDLTICNPPFSHGLEFFERALRNADSRSTVAFLLRLTFLESEERRAFHQRHVLDCYVLSTRPKFRPGRDGKMATDSVTCAWFVAGPGRAGRVEVL